MSEGIKCEICGESVHLILSHLKEAHPEVSVDDYKERFPEKPLFSEKGRLALLEARSKKKEEEAARKNMPSALDGSQITMLEDAFHTVYGLGNAKAAKSSRGDPIMISTFNYENNPFVPEVDGNFIFDINKLKSVVIAFEMNLPVYLWGYHGTGKTTLIQQACARAGRPCLRVQHTVGTEESHIIGQWTVRDGATIFELGPLPLAMLNGWTYLADEYDYALPNVLSVYQPVLEGAPLVIKEADAANRVIHPHPNFRIAATGNTNGCGDETGMYQGTQIQNAANYDRFGVVEEIGYMPAKQEVKILTSQARVDANIAAQFVTLANAVRAAYKSGTISSTLSPRSLITAAKLGFVRGDWHMGLQLAFTNKLSRVDQEAVNQLAQRHVEKAPHAA